MEENQYIIVLGNLNDGFAFVGPFASFDEADEYARKYTDATWIAEITTP